MSETHSERLRRSIRVVTTLAGALAVALALGADLLVAGEPGFGWGQTTLAVAGVALLALRLLPLVWSLRVLTMALGFGLALLVAEMLALLVRADRYAVIYQMDDRVLHRPIPGSSRLYRHSPINGGHTVRVDVNADGYIGPPLRPAGEAQRVLVLGDSFIAGEFSRFEDRFVTQLGLRLSERFDRAIETINAGVAAYGPDQILMRMESDIVRLRPDLVVIAIFADNDFGDLLRNKIFRLDDSGTLQLNAYRLSPELRSQFARAHGDLLLLKILRQGFQALDRHVHLGSPDASRLRNADWVADALTSRMTEYRDAVLAGNTQVTNLLEDGYDADISLTPEIESGRYKTSLMGRVLLRIKETAEQLGSPLVLLIIPSPVDVSDTYDYSVDQTKFPEYRRTALSDAVWRIAERHGILALNLFGPFRTHGDQNDLYFHGGNNHWNNAGQALAAEVLADFIVQRELLPVDRPAVDERR